MTTYLRSELRKLRHTRSLFALPLVGALVSVVAATVLITSFDEPEIAASLSEHGPLRFGATNLGLLLAVFGARVFADETHHGTLASTYLASPHRRAVVAAKAVVAAATAVATSAAVYLVVVPITVVSVEVRDLSMTIDADETAALFGRGTAAMVAMTLLGLSLATAVRNRAVALITVAVWFTLVERAVGSLLRVEGWLPGSLVDELVTATGEPTATPTIALTLAAAVAVTSTAATVSLGRDVA
jgi:ABC-2 type transport system permease protein